MTAIGQASVANVEATLNGWMMGQLSTLTRPSYVPVMPGFAVDWPDWSVDTLPVFSFAHTPISASIAGSGDIVDSDGTHGTWMKQMFWVSCWVTRANTSWSIQVRSMADMVLNVYTANRVQVIKDYIANLSNPSNSNYVVQLLDAEIAIPPADPNVDVRRRDVRILYQWVYRN